MKSKVRFSYGKLVFNVGDIVPHEIAIKYPRLVEEATEKEKKEFKPEPKKEYEGEVISTAKRKK